MITRRSGDPSRLVVQRSVTWISPRTRLSSRPGRLRRGLRALRRRTCRLYPCGGAWCQADQQTADPLQAGIQLVPRCTHPRVLPRRPFRRKLLPGGPVFALSTAGRRRQESGLMTASLLTNLPVNSRTRASTWPLEGRRHPLHDWSCVSCRMSGESSPRGRPPAPQDRRSGLGACQDTGCWRGSNTTSRRWAPAWCHPESRRGQRDGQPLFR
jgi:hypothetical protein